MATATRKRRGNKSAKIREMLAAGKEPSEIATALKMKQPSLIYQIRSKMSRKKHGKKRAGKPSSNGGLHLEHLLAARKLIEHVGGIETAKAALTALEKLT